MNNQLFISAVLAGLFVLTGPARGETTMTETNPPAGLYGFTLKDIDGKDVALSNYTGKVILIVNVASKCGFTPQYAGLQALYERFAKEGFFVLGLPANNFKGQEPGSNEEIKRFCTLTYKVTFPMFAKISVAGDDQHPLYTFLTSKETNPGFDGKITWNFNKFLVGRDGRVAARFDSRAKPDDQAVLEAIEKALKAPAP